MKATVQRGGRGVRQLVAAVASFFSGWPCGNSGQNALAGLTLMALLTGSCTVLATENETTVLPYAAQVEYAADSSNLVLSYTELLPELAEQDVTPRVRLYGDGRLLIHRPPHMKRSGTWETQLEPVEVDELLQSVVPTLYGFDDRSLRLDLKAREKSAASQRLQGTERVANGKQARGLLYARFDAPISYFELNVKAFGRSKSDSQIRINAPIYVAWEGLALDLRRFPDQAMLRNLNAVERTMRALERHQDLVQITELRP